MKYIKYFESNDYYEEVPSRVDRVVSIPGGHKSIRFDVKIIHQIMKILGLGFKPNSDLQECLSKGFTSHKAVFSTRPWTRERNDNTHIIIVFFEDEWFGVDIDKYGSHNGDYQCVFHKTFKCDQLKGLEQCLKDNKVI